MTQFDCHDVAMMEEMTARYAVMAGIDKNMTTEGRKDRLRFGAKYLCYVDGEPALQPLKIIRFGVDVCGLTMRQATYAVRYMIEDLKLSFNHYGDNPRKIAAEFLHCTGDIFEAVALARFLEWVYRETEFDLWGDVRDYLINMVVHPESESGQEAAE
jgi:hypothetical protein